MKIIINCNVIIVLSLFLGGCSSIINDDQLNIIKNGSHGYIEFIFRDRDSSCVNSMKHKVWVSTIIINNIEYVSNYEFKGGTSYIVPVHSGQVVIEYKLIYNSDFYGEVCKKKETDEYNSSSFVIYKTGDSRLYSRYASTKVIEFVLAPNEKKIIKIKNVRNKKHAFGCIGHQGCVIPFPHLFQEVAFEVEKVEDLNNNNSK